VEKYFTYPIDTPQRRSASYPILDRETLSLFLLLVLMGATCSAGALAKRQTKFLND
jgi:hypothetical protein